MKAATFGAAGLAVCVASVMGVAALLDTGGPARAAVGPARTMAASAGAAARAVVATEYVRRTGVLAAEFAAPAQLAREAAVPVQRDVAGASVSERGAVTLISQTTLNARPYAARPLVLPVTFGRPTAPQDDLPVASRAWHNRHVARHGRIARS